MRELIAVYGGGYIGNTLPEKIGGIEMNNTEQVQLPVDIQEVTANEELVALQKEFDEAGLMLPISVQMDCMVPVEEKEPLFERHYADDEDTETGEEIIIPEF